MADISKIKLPDNNTYDIAVYTDHIKPQQTKTFTDVIGTENNFTNATFYFGKIRPTSWLSSWSIKYQVYVSAAGSTSANGRYTVEIYGSGQTYAGYKIWNHFISTTYRPTYYHIIYVLKETGFNNGYGHLIGESLSGSWNPITAANSRTFTIDILECKDCVFEFFDTPLKYANVPGAGATNYNTYYQLNAASQGLQEIGDVDTWENRVNYFNAKTGTKGIWAGSFFMRTTSGTYENICTASDGTATSSNRTTATTKKANTSYFQIGSPIWYTSTNYNANTNISGNGAIYCSTSLVDSRYAFNTSLTAGSLTVYEPLYLVGTIDTNGFKLDTTWWTQTPTDTSKIYILFGGVYDSTTSNCRVALYEHNPWLVYDGTRLIPFTYSSATTSKKGIVQLSSATNSTSTTEAATPSAVKTAYDLANTANGTANTVLSGLNGTLIYDHTYTISNGVATFTPHVYLKGEEVTTNYAKSCFVWKYKLANDVTGTPSYIPLTTNDDRTCTVTISVLGYGGYVLGEFTPPA